MQSCIDAVLSAVDIPADFLDLSAELALRRERLVLRNATLDTRELMVDAAFSEASALVAAAEARGRSRSSQDAGAAGAGDSDASGGDGRALTAAAAAAAAAAAGRPGSSTGLPRHRQSAARSLRESGEASTLTAVLAPHPIAPASTALSGEGAATRGRSAGLPGDPLGQQRGPAVQVRDGMAAPPLGALCASALSSRTSQPEGEETLRVEPLSESPAGYAPVPVLAAPLPLAAAAAATEALTDGA